MSIIQNSVQVSNSHLNSSKSKQTYSFPKAQRFQEKRDIIPEYNYHLPNIRNQRSTSFGYGEKMDIAKQTVRTPSPNQYENLISQFSKSKGAVTGIGFGLGRDNIKFATPFPQQNLKVPGPGNYSLENSMLSNISFSMGKKIPLSDYKHTNKYTPSPGQYDSHQITALNASGRYTVANFKSQGATVINPDRGSKNSNRELIDSQYVSKIPGPNQYETQTMTSLNSRGTYYIQKYRNSQSRSFTHQKRETIKINKEAPGVGQYDLPSEFGKYGGIIKQ